MSIDSLRIVFFGTPEFAAKILSALVNAGHDVIACVCQPDRPKGRSSLPVPPPTKVYAQSRGIPVLQPTRLKTGDFPEWMNKIGADVSVVAAYGRILPARVLYAPKWGSLNVHASLLPNYRGAAPIQRAILDGRTETGVTIMQMDEGLDTGGVLLQRSITIRNNDTSETLHDKLADLGASAVLETLVSLRAGELVAVPQDDAKATVAPLIRKEDGIVDWRTSAVHIHRLVRAMYPWPGALTHHRGAGLKIFPFGTPDMSAESLGTPGTVLDVTAEGIRVACGEGAVLLTELQVEGRKRLPVAALLCGYRIDRGDMFE